MFEDSHLCKEYSFPSNGCAAAGTDRGMNAVQCARADGANSGFSLDWSNSTAHFIAVRLLMMQTVVGGE